MAENTTAAVPSAIVLSICEEFGCSVIETHMGSPYIETKVVDKIFTGINSDLYVGMPDMNVGLRKLLRNQGLHYSRESRQVGELLSMEAFITLLLGGGPRLRSQFVLPRRKLLNSITKLVLEGKWVNLSEYDSERMWMEEQHESSDSYEDVYESEDDDYDAKSGCNSQGELSPSMALLNEAIMNHGAQQDVYEDSSDDYVPSEGEQEKPIKPKVRIRISKASPKKKKKEKYPVRVIAPPTPIVPPEERELRWPNKEKFVRRGPCLICGKHCAVPCRTHHPVCEDHIIEKDGRLHFQCPHCDKTFRRKDLGSTNLITHIQYKHEGKPNPLVCDKCGRSFETRNNLRNHKKIHEGPKLQCEVCQRRFVKHYALKTHMRQHTGEKPYMCEHCGKSFCQNVSYRFHKCEALGRRLNPLDGRQKGVGRPKKQTTVANTT